MKSKSDTFDAFKQFKVYAEMQLNVKLAALRDGKDGLKILDQVPAMRLPDITLWATDLSRMVCQITRGGSSTIPSPSALSSQNALYLMRGTLSWSQELVICPSFLLSPSHHTFFPHSEPTT